MPTTLLLIGAHGFAGRHFADAAAAAGFDVVGAARRGGEAVVDLLEPETIAAALERTAPEVVVNLAGSASVAESFRDPFGTFEANALGCVNLLAAVAERRPGAYVLCVSSGEVYGSPEPGELPLAEDAPLRPASPYAASKAAMEVVCGQFERAEGLRIGLVRAFNHTGPGQADVFAASSFARQAAEAERDGREEVVLRTGNLEVERDFSDVRDIARAYLGLCERELSGTFNACSEQPVPVRRLVEHLDAASPLAVRTETDPDRVRAGEAPCIYGSAERLRDATGWQPKIPLERTVADLLEWWRGRANRRG